MTEKTRYTEKDLSEFKELILAKLQQAKEDYKLYKSAMTHSDSNDATDTAPTFKVLEEGAATMAKEIAAKLAKRQLDFIGHLQAALKRIEAKTYGICQKTGKLIPKERLRAVPHASMCIEAKESQYERRKRA
jgi:DnaK suppressor protein